MHDAAPRRTYLAELAAWTRRTTDTPTLAQSPAEELLGEHHLMDLVLVAMESEAKALSQGAALRTGFWADVVDFIGNFVHRCHRAKEERVFYPTAVRNNLVGAARAAALEHEHGDAKTLTIGICEGVEAGDWEQVVRLVSMYVYFMRHHMRSEEMELVMPSTRELDAAVHAEIADAFRAIEATALGDRDRRHYIELVRRVCETAGVAHDLDD